MQIPVKLHAVAAALALASVCGFSQDEAVWPHHPNRPGAEAFFHGGAFVSNTGSVTAMLFNPAGLAKMPERFSFLVEGGWHSQTEYLDFFNYNFTADFLPLQFAAAAFHPAGKISAGLFYSQPANYRLDLHDSETAGNENGPNLQRAYDVVGLALAFDAGRHFIAGGGVEWRQARLQDQLSFYTAEGKMQDWQFSLGAIAMWQSWQFGFAMRSRYEARGERPFSPVQGEAVVVQEPLAFRFGFTAPAIAGRVRLSADAEFKNFEANHPVARWQFYGGGLWQLSPAADLGLGGFTFRKDYSSFVDGPPSEFYLTAGGTLKLAGFRLTASYMDGDLLSQDFQGQRFFNVALGYALR